MKGDIKCIKELKDYTDSVLSVCFSPDSRLLATGSLDESVKIYEMTRDIECIKELNDHNDTVSSSCFSISDVLKLSEI